MARIHNAMSRYRIRVSLKDPPVPIRVLLEGRFGDGLDVRHGRPPAELAWAELTAALLCLVR